MGALFRAPILVFFSVFNIFFKIRSYRRSFRNVGSHHCSVKKKFPSNFYKVDGIIFTLVVKIHQRVKQVFKTYMAGDWRKRSLNKVFNLCRVRIHGFLLWVSNWWTRHRNEHDSLEILRLYASYLHHALFGFVTHELKKQVTVKLLYYYS